MIIKRYKFENRDEWSEIRSRLVQDGRVGGSMLGSIRGVNAWKSPYEVWAELTGRLPEADISDREAVRVGRDLEDYVAKRFCEASGKQVRRENSILTNLEYPHLFASIDRRIVGEDAGLECKTASAFRDDDFTSDGIPASYLEQCKCYMAVTGAPRWYLSVLVLGVGFKTFLITTDPTDALVENVPPWVEQVFIVEPPEIAECEAAARHFYEAYVATNTPPPLVGSESERAAICAVHGEKEIDETARMDYDLEALCDQYTTLKTAGTAHDDEIKRVRNMILEALAGRPFCASAAWKVTAKRGSARTLDTDKLKSYFGGKIPDEFYSVKPHAMPTLRVTRQKSK